MDIKNKYLIAITQSLDDNGRRDDKRVEVYKRLEAFVNKTYMNREVNHVRLIGSFPLYDSQKGRVLTLDEITEKAEEILAKQETARV